jgi:saccharopine dehydrogenase-like NADP-dependent oxidoreductase
MQKIEVLVAGGYGSVGTHISTLLSADDRFSPVIAGRSEDKAKDLAQKLGCKWTRIDLIDKKSIEEAIQNANVVINCFVPSADFNTLLAEQAAEKGIYYLDIAAFNIFNERVVEINNSAVQKGSTLITALGLYPGIASLVIASNKDHFDLIDSIDIYFTSGGKMEGLSLLSLQGIKLMMDETPRIWNGSGWVTAESRGTKEYISKPFHKRISFYPFMITYDLLKIPEIIKCDKITMWSGTESLFQGIVFFLGMKMGLAKNSNRAKKFIKILRFIGRYKNENYSMKIVSKGIKDEKHLERVVEMNAPEELLTATVPVIVCEQIAQGGITKAGSFTAAEVINIRTFFESFKEKGIAYQETFKKG